MTYNNRLANTRVEILRENNLRGIGPRFALCTMWKYSGLSLYGQLGAGLMVGTLTGQSRQKDFTSVGTEIDRIKVDMDYGTRIVPIMTARLGTGYEYAGSWGGLKVYFGWEVQNYFNAVSYYQTYDDVQDAAGANDQSDIGLDGFFLGFTFSYNFGT